MIRERGTSVSRVLVLVVGVLVLVGGLAVAVGATGQSTTETTTATEVTHSLTVSLADVPGDGTTQTVAVSVPDVLAGTLSVAETETSARGLSVSDARIVDGPDDDGVRETVAVDVSGNGERTASGSVSVTVVGTYPELSAEEAAAIEVGGVTGTVEYAVDRDDPTVAAYIERSNSTLSDVAMAGSLLGVTPPDGVVVTDLRASVTNERGFSLSVPLYRIGGEPAADVSPDRIAFNESGERTVTLENDGEVPLALSAPHFVGNESAFEATIGTDTLPVGGEVTITVTHTGSGGETAELIVRTNRTASQLVRLRGPPVAVEGPSVALSAAELDFSNTAERTVTVTNNGGVPLSLTAPSVDAERGGFEVQRFDQTLAPGERTTISVSYTGEVGFDGPVEELGVLTVGTNQTATQTVTLLGVPEPASDDQEDDADERDDPIDQPARTMTMDVVSSDSNTTTMEATVENASAGEQVTMEVTDDADSDVAVQNISVIPSRDGDFSLNVTSTSRDEPPSSMAMMNTTRVQPLGFMDIQHSLSNEDIENASLTVRVKKSRIASMPTTDAEDIALYRDTGNGWVEQRTVWTDETETYNIYTVYTDGFSDWATAGKQASFRIVQTDVNVTSVQVEDAISVLVRIQNNGAADGEYETELILNDVVVEDRRIAIAADGTGQVNFERRLQNSGTYQVQVNDVIVDEIQVEEPADTGGTSDTSGDFPLVLVGGGVLALLVVLGGGAYVVSGGDTEETDATDQGPRTEPSDDAVAGEQATETPEDTTNGQQDLADELLGEDTGENRETDDTDGKP